MATESPRQARLNDKKRSQIRSQSKLAPPRDFDSTRYAGRWVAEHRLNERSDGYEPRGFLPWKNEEGSTTRVGDLVWCYMDKEEAEERKAIVEAETRAQIGSLKEQMAEEEDRLNYELGNYSGRSTTDIKVNKY